MRSFISILLSIMALALNSEAFADGHGNETSPEGAFTTLMVQANDVAAYIKALESNKSVFEATGTTAAGYCLTRSGHDYPGQMFIWNAHTSLSNALVASDKYDPLEAPAPALAALREVKYGVTWKPLKPFKLDPGFERQLRVVVPASSMATFVEKITAAEQGVQAAGHDMNIGVFDPIGGGAIEANTLHVRAVAQNAESFGKILEEYYAGASYGEPWNEAFAMVTSIKNDYMQRCEQVYSAE